MFTTFSTALSGLNSMTNAIDVVGNNLANLNTAGYKDVGVSFQEIMSAATGGSATTQVGLGVSRPDANRQFVQGAIQTTGGQYDAAIQGSGFFVVKGSGGQTLFSRDGSFQVDKTGYLVTAGGERVQGWSANNGVVNTNAALGDIEVPIGASLQPTATSQFSLSANLDSSTAPVVGMSAAGTTTGTAAITTGTNDTLNLTINGAAKAFTLNPADTSIAQVAADLQSQMTAAGVSATATVNASGNLVVTSTSTAVNSGVQVMSGNANATLGLTVTPTGATYNNTYATGVIQAVDSLGNVVPLTLSFTKETTNGTWNYSVSSAQGTVSGGTGTVQFNNTGQMVSINSPTVSPNGQSDTVKISGLPDGSAPMSMSWNFFNADGTPKLTQFAQTSGPSADDQNGQVAAELTSVSIGNGGNVLAQYSSGAQVIAAQLGLASVRNAQSLVGVSDNNYTLGADSALPTVGVAGTGGRGTIEGGAKEGSTVDIASEFSSLLTFQRSYQANSRVITVSDEMSQETVNLIK